MWFQVHLFGRCLVGVVLLLELDRAEVAQPFLDAVGVVEAVDVLEEREVCFGPGGEDAAVDALTLAAAQDTGARIALPRPGEPFEPTAQTVPSEPWWRAVAPQPLERRPGGAARITDLSADPGRGSEGAEAEANHAEVAPTA